MMTGNPFPNNAWLTYAEATARWGKPTSPKQVEYILATPAALSDHPTVKQMMAEAEALGMERAAQICTDAEDTIFGKSMDLRTAAITIRAEAAALRKETT